ncbi:MAG TPA: cytochrome c [Isosphaeraceae bacterium]|jgi:cytochrome c556
MKRLAVLLGMVALLGLGGLAGAYDDPPSIKKAMGQLHKGQKAALPSIKAELKSDSPDWKKVKDTSKIIVTLSESITDLEPPRGDKENYAKLSKAYFANAKGLNEAAEAEDAAKAKAAVGKLFSTCKTCHESHQAKK